MIAHPKTRPAKDDTLRNSINTKFKTEPSLAASVYQSLVNQSAVKIENGKVIYNEAKIQALANTDSK